MASWPVHRGLLIAAGVCGLTGVLAGTFAAHALKGHLTTEMLQVFETGVRYHLAHAVALLVLGMIAGSPPRSRARAITAAAGWFIVAGVIIFSGSLYALALSDQRWLGRITPFGGVSLLLGWLLVMLAGFRANAKPDE